MVYPSGGGDGGCSCIYSLITILPISLYRLIDPAVTLIAKANYGKSE